MQRNVRVSEQSRPLFVRHKLVHGSLGASHWTALYGFTARRFQRHHLLDALSFGKAATSHFGAKSMHRIEPRERGAT